MRARIGETAFDVLLRKGGPKEGAFHQIAAAVGLALLAEELVPHRERGADRATGIARGRLHPDVLEGAVAQNLAIGDAIERDAAGETEIFKAMIARERARQPQHHLLRHLLDRGCDIPGTGEEFWRARMGHFTLKPNVRLPHVLIGSLEHDPNISLPLIEVFQHADPFCCQLMPRCRKKAPSQSVILSKSRTKSAGICAAREAVIEGMVGGVD